MFVVWSFDKNTYSMFQVSHVEQELLTLPESLSSPPVVSGVRVADL